MTKVLHLSHHYGCLKDHQYVCDKLGLDLTNKLSIWNDIIKRDVYCITREIANSTWKEHKDYFNSFDFIISAQFELEKSNSIDIKRKKLIASKGRIKTQPLKFRSAGSVFKNPSLKLPAGFLIDKIGLKGTKCGDAEISTHHANFFINHGNASASDITTLIRIARKAVLEKFDIELELEIKTIGFEQKELEAYG